MYDSRLESSKHSLDQLCSRTFILSPNVDIYRDVSAENTSEKGIH